MPKTFTILLFFFLYSSFLYTQSEEPSVLIKNGEVSSIKLEEAVWRNVDATPILQDSFGRLFLSLMSDHFVIFPPIKEDRNYQTMNLFNKMLAYYNIYVYF